MTNQDANEPLHLSATTTSLPHADDILSRINTVRKNDSNFKRSATSSSLVVRRNPYGSSSTTKPGINANNSSASQITSRSKFELNESAEDVLPSSDSAPFVLNFAVKNGQTAAYNSYRHGTRSIARNKQTGSLDRSAQHESRMQKTSLANSPQLDLAPDASLTQAFMSGLFRSGQKLVDDLNGASERSIRYQQLMLLVPVLIIFCLSAPSMLDSLSKSAEWQWTPDRRLDDRQCVMNLFIEKQPLDEYSPDYVEPKKADKEMEKKTGKKFKQPPPQISEGTYRTKGQMKVVTRLIEAVADSFRSNTTIQQHLLFTGTRDGGQLAEIALKHWPPRGSFRTQLHLIAADHKEPGSVLTQPPKIGDNVIASADPLMYGYLDAIETRFMGKDQVHIYDRSGVAGIVGDDDDDTDEYLWGSRRKLQAVSNNTAIISIDDDTSSGEESVDAYPGLDTLLVSDEEEIGIIPYMHVDGESMADQLEILESARPLFEDNAVVVVGIEHSPDMDVYKLIDHFNSVKYKTFFLGSRQIARIDHLCPEILNDIIRHPVITRQKVTRIGRWLKMLGLSGEETVDDDDRMKKYPPFFVAMPRGRLNREEMTIQHMYDLFGGYGGGGGQIKTANDRKAPGKK